jgi:hypothetical protein
MFVPHFGGQVLTSPMLPASLIVAAIAAHALPNTFEIRHRWNGVMVFEFAVLFMLVLARLYSGQASPFLYYQF